LCDPKVNPALYHAGVFAIRVATWYFMLHGPYNGTAPKKEEVQKELDRWCKSYPGRANYLAPPDYRILWVQEDGVALTDPRTRRLLWTKACQRVMKTSLEKKRALLTGPSHEQLIK
jgi:hypothetical protein